jgi:hypothetical protein
MSDPPPLPHGGAPNAFVAEKATMIDVLALDQVALLGVAGSDGDMRALLRMPDGAIFSGKQSERSAIGTLLEVSRAGVVVELPNGNATFLGIIHHA